MSATRKQLRPGTVERLKCAVERRHGIGLRIVLRICRSFSWAIYADPTGADLIPVQLAAGGVADSSTQADRQAARRLLCAYQYGLEGFTRPLGRAGW